MPLVIGSNQCPGRHRCRRPVDHVAHCVRVVVPLLPVTPVLRRDFEALETGLLAVLESRQLLFLGDRQPELDHQHAIAVQLPLEIIDLLIGALPIADRAKFLHAFHQDTAIPGPGEDGEPPQPGDMPPEPPEIWLRPFLFGRSGNRHHLVLSGVQGPRDTPDRATLAGSVRPLEDRDYGLAQDGVKKRKRKGR
eukprot:TRINITY_DN472_c1_g1_i1.p3 TRINITY_DN472_c1_g1~~TRINITY_DN472_c1_g1_i1.p3  ORF type:complete len:193 (-),score=7.65 TRINITY_DN472_c1_g1_i1:40-618(-)